MRSNPLKPFKMCHAWAWRVLEEFFNQAQGMGSRHVLLWSKPVACVDRMVASCHQGDTEKELGLPVGRSSCILSQACQRNVCSCDGRNAE